MKARGVGIMQLTELFDMSGRTAIVTGGAGHLGRTISQALGEMGAHVVICDRDEGRATRVAGELSQQGIGCGYLVCDTSVEDEIVSAVEKTTSDYGQLDVMVCCAGGSRRPAEIQAGSVAHFCELYERNALATYVSAKAAATAMIKAQRGSIIFIASLHGFQASDPRRYEGVAYERSGAGYFAAKGAVINLARALAVDYGRHGIRVNCISPGYIPNASTDPRMVDRWRDGNPLGIGGQPDNLKGAVALLASDAGSWITGHNLVVDGGWSIW
jgi:NAD(P)-dependent dehydrogenase (short-subunit alcohol dehydrogenase family)